MKKRYFYMDDNGSGHGPVSEQLFEKKGLVSSRKVWYDGLPIWVEAGSVPAFKKYISKQDSLGDGSNTSIHPSKNEEANIAIKHMPKSWLFESIVVTLFCFLPFGIAGIIYATKTRSSWESGLYAKSLHYSSLAHRWTVWGFSLFFIFWLIYVTVALTIGAKDMVGLYNKDWMWLF